MAALRMLVLLVAAPFGERQLENAIEQARRGGCAAARRLVRGGARFATRSFRPAAARASRCARCTGARHAWRSRRSCSLEEARVPSVSSTRCAPPSSTRPTSRSEEHTSELQSRLHLVCRLLLEKKKKKIKFNFTNKKKQIK